MVVGSVGKLLIMRNFNAPEIDWVYEIAPDDTWATITGFRVGWFNTSPRRLDGGSAKHLDW